MNPGEIRADLGGGSSTTRPTPFRRWASSYGARHPRDVNGIAAYIAEGETPAAQAEEFIRAVILTDQLDPDEVVQAMADLAEADTTPVETFLPEGIMELIRRGPGLTASNSGNPVSLTVPCPWELR